MTVDAIAGSPRRYSLLASAIAGTELQVVWALPTHPTWTDGHTIHLDRQHRERAREVVVVQAALVAAGSLAPDALRRLRRRGRARQGYLALEVPRALVAVRDRLPPGVDIPDTPLPTLTPAESVELALRHRAGLVPDPLWGEIRVTSNRGAGTALPTATALDLVGEPARRSPDPPDDAERTHAPSTTSRWSSGGTVRQRRRRTGSGARSDRTEAPLTLQPGTRARALAQPARTRMVRPTAGPTLTDEPPRGGAMIARYPEWRVDRSAYAPEWCTVRAVAPDALPDRPNSPDRGAPMGDVEVRRRIAALQLDPAHVRRELEGDDLDLDALVDARCDAAVDGLAEDRVYSATRRLARDLGVLVLLDASDSTSGRAPDQTSVFELQRQAAGVLVRGFERSGDRVACVAFRSYGRHRIEMIPVKPFAHRFDATARHTLGALTPSGFTRLGAAIRHATAVLRTDSGTRRWLLAVLSDGFPFDSSYEGEQAQADTRRALAEARRAGVGPVCMTLGGGSEESALSTVFGTAAHASAPSLRDLAPRLTVLFASALASADRSRRLAESRRDPSVS